MMAIVLDKICPEWKKIFYSPDFISNKLMKILSLQLVILHLYSTRIISITSFVDHCFASKWYCLDFMSTLKIQLVYEVCHFILRADVVVYEIMSSCPGRKRRLSFWGQCISRDCATRWDVLLLALVLKATSISWLCYRCHVTTSSINSCLSQLLGYPTINQFI